MEAAVVVVGPPPGVPRGSPGHPGPYSAGGFEMPEWARLPNPPAWRPYIDVGTNRLGTCAGAYPPAAGLDDEPPPGFCARSSIVARSAARAPRGGGGPGALEEQERGARWANLRRPPADAPREDAPPACRARPL